MNNICKTAKMQMARFLDMLDEKRVKRPNVRECALILQKHSKSDYPVEVHFLTFGLCAKISHLSPFVAICRHFHQACKKIWPFWLLWFGTKNNVYLLVRHVPFIAKSAEESCTEGYGKMMNHQIYFSGLTRFIHTCLSLICEIWMFFYL